MVGMYDSGQCVCASVTTALEWPLNFAITPIMLVPWTSSINSVCVFAVNCSPMPSWSRSWAEQQNRTQIGTCRIYMLGFIVFGFSFVTGWLVTSTPQAPKQSHINIKQQQQSQLQFSVFIETSTVLCFAISHRSQCQTNNLVHDLFPFGAKSWLSVGWCAFV